MRPELHEIEARLLAALPGAQIALADDSHLHAGHEGARGGAGHFRVRVVSDAFVGRATLARHRLVYDSVRDWMPHRIHALVIEARTPDEAAREPKDPTP